MTNLLDILSQVAIFIFGVLGVVLVARKNKWGFVFGVMVQPFWFMTAFFNEQWGVFLISIVYTASWSYGIYEWFFKKEKVVENAK